jgi:hypothetical protein
MGLGFMCAEKILGLFKKRVRPDKKHNRDRKNPSHEKSGIYAGTDLPHRSYADTSEGMVCKNDVCAPVAFICVYQFITISFPSLTQMTCQAVCLLVSSTPQKHDLEQIYRAYFGSLMYWSGGVKITCFIIHLFGDTFGPWVTSAIHFEYIFTEYE